MGRREGTQLQSSGVGHGGHRATSGFTVRRVRPTRPPERAVEKTHPRGSKVSDRKNSKDVVGRG